MINVHLPIVLNLNQNTKDEERYLFLLHNIVDIKPTASDNNNYAVIKTVDGIEHVIQESPKHIMEALEEAKINIISPKISK